MKYVEWENFKRKLPKLSYSFEDSILTIEIGGPDITIFDEDYDKVLRILEIYRTFLHDVVLYETFLRFIDLPVSEETLHEFKYRVEWECNSFINVNRKTLLGIWQQIIRIN